MDSLHLWIWFWITARGRGFGPDDLNPARFGNRRPSEISPAIIGTIRSETHNLLERLFDMKRLTLLLREEILLQADFLQKMYQICDI